VYNAECFLEECVASIRNQTYRNLEIILIDDGSADGSPAICDRLAAEDDRIVVLHRKNGGVSAARNAGLAIAKSGYITFADCDDRIAPEMYETLLRVLMENDADAAVSTFREELPHGGVRETDSGNLSVFTGTEATAAILGNIENRTTHRMMIWFFVWNKLYRASLLQNIQFDPATDSAEDVPFNLKVFARASRVVLLEKPLYFWRRREESLSNHHTARALRGGARTSLVMYEYAAALPKPYRRTAVTAAFRNLYWYYSFCIAEIHSAPKKSRGADRSEYLALRDEMREFLTKMRTDAAYLYLTRGYKAAVFLMIKTPGFFSALWRAYRFLKFGHK